MLPHQINESLVVIFTLFKFWLFGFHQPAQEKKWRFSFTGYQNYHIQTGHLRSKINHFNLKVEVFLL